jgi:SagB-type dehydrogenase family enzyme
VSDDLALIRTTIAARPDRVRRSLLSSVHQSAVVGGHAQLDPRPGGQATWSGGGLGHVDGAFEEVTAHRIVLVLPPIAAIEGFGLGPQPARYRAEIELTATDDATDVLFRCPCASAAHAGLVGAMWSRRLFHPLKQCVERYAALVDRDAKLALSRHAAFMWSKDSVNVLSGAAGRHMTLPRALGSAVVATFAEPRRFVDAPAERTIDTLADAVEALAGARVLVPEGSETDPEARWEPHELLFHQISTHAGNAAWHGLGRDTCPAERKPPMSTSVVAFPDPSKLPPVSLDSALASRRSIREFARSALPLETLSTFLSSTARDAPTDSASRWNHTWSPGSYVARRYPSGGARYSVELYAVIGDGALERVDAGIYRYAPDRHRLERLVTGSAEIAPLLASVPSESLMRPPPGTSRADAIPPLLFVITSRIGRVSFKYGGLAYKLVLQEVGGLYQTFQLAATALGLAACPLGVAPPALAALCSLPTFEEPVVGAIMLGPRHPNAAA